MAPNLRGIAVGLLLIVVGFLANFVASSALPPLPACASSGCDLALDVALASFFVIVLGIGIQFFSLARGGTSPAPTAGPDPAAPGPGSFASGLTPPPFAVAPPPAPPPPPGPLSPPHPATAPLSGSGSTVRCDRCASVHPAGRYAYCPACGTPLPFTA